MIVDGADLLGDGVNLAARLQTMAEPGGILISRQVYDQVHGKLTVGFQHLGERHARNMPEEVDVYRVSVGGAAAEAPTELDTAVFLSPPPTAAPPRQAAPAPDIAPPPQPAAAPQPQSPASHTDTAPADKHSAMSWSLRAAQLSSIWPMIGAAAFLFLGGSGKKNDS